MAFTIDPAFGHWLAGFIDGEGCFAVTPVRNGFSCMFRISLRADDLPMLEEIHQKLGVGYVWEGHSPSAKNPCAIFQINDKEGCRRLVEVLDQYPLRAKKRNDFYVWRMAVQEWLSVRKGVRQDWGALRELRDTLMLGRAYAKVS